MANLSSGKSESFDSLIPQDQKSIISTSSIDTLDGLSIEFSECQGEDILGMDKTSKAYKLCSNKVSANDFHLNDKTYWIPLNDVEKNRLSGQHFAIKDLFEGNVLSKVHEVVDFQKGASILDVGCGTCIWILDMIEDYPNCTFEGCDINDLIGDKLESRRFGFSFGDIVKGLSYPDNTFDFVHMRMMLSSLSENDWPIAIKELVRVTKPGGAFQLNEFHLKKTGGPTLQRAIEGTHKELKAKGQDPNVVDRLEEIIEQVGGCKIILSEYRSASLSSNTSFSKKLRWDWEEGFTSIVPVISETIGIKTEEERKQFLKDLRKDLATSEGYTYMKAIAVQKL